MRIKEKTNQKAGFPNVGIAEETNLQRDQIRRILPVAEPQGQRRGRRGRGGGGGGDGGGGGGGIRRQRAVGAGDLAAPASQELAPNRSNVSAQDRDSP